MLTELSVYFNSRNVNKHKPIYARNCLLMKVVCNCSYDKFSLPLVPRKVIIDQEYTNFTVITGDAVIFTCVPDSDELFVIKWRKNGIFLPSQANQSLFVNFLDRNNSGRYECVATNQRRQELLAVDVVVFGEYNAMSFLTTSPWHK